jgi:hypothetical protein
MCRLPRTVVALALSLLSARLGHAEAPSPTGHWDGAIHAPYGDVRVAVDLEVDDAGRLRGTFSNPGERINGLPLASAAVDGRSVDLRIKAGADPQAFKGTLSADGRSMSGQFLVSVYGVPFDLARTGDARFDPAPKSAPIDRALEGTWRGSLGTQALTLTLTNHADKTASGTWGLDEGVQIPITIKLEASTVTIGSNVTSETYIGTFDSASGEIVGTFKEGAQELPLTFRRVQ